MASLGLVGAVEVDDEEVIFRDKKSTLATFDHRDLIKEFAINTIIHGDYSLPPLQSMDSGFLFNFVREGWTNLGLNVGNRLQRCAWPHIIRGHDSFIVGLNKSGKTLSYLAPICALLLSDVIGWKKLSGKGPVVVIFTHNTYSSIKIEHLAQTLLNSSNINQIQCTAVTEYSAKTYHMCSEGVEIIIITPELFLAKADRVEWLDLNRLKFFVLDDAHCSLRIKKELVVSLFTKYKNLCHEDAHKNAHPQIIVCGSEWDNDIESVYWTMPRKPTVIIRNLKAAVSYGKIKCRIQYVEPGYKLSTLMNLLDKRTLNPFYNRIIVVCGTSRTCKEVRDRIASQENYNVRLCSISNQDEMKANIGIWKSAARHECMIFIVKDEVLKYFEVKDANYLIHYDIEDLTSVANVSRKSVFFDRFLCLWDNLRNISEVTKESSDAQKEKAISDVFMTTEEKDLDRIVKTFVSVGFELPQVVLKQASQVRRRKESEWPLCESLKRTGQCELLKLGTCNTRHTINIDDLKKVSTLPKSGKVELVIKQCSSVNSFVGQIIRHFPSGNREEAVSMLKDLEERQSFLKQFFADEKNRIPPERIEVDVLCAIKMGEDNYTRGKLVQIVTKYSMTLIPKIVLVFCVDTGESVMREAQSELFMLPKWLEDLPYLSVEAILIGVKPPSNASEYSSHHLQFVKATVLDNVFQAEICMSVGNTVWITSMKQMSDESERLTLRQQLLHKKYASFNPLHGDWIWSINSRSLDSLLDPFFVKTFYQNDPDYDWAFIPIINSNEPSTELFSVTHVDCPNGLFGTRDKFIDQFNRLDEDIQFETENLMTRYKEYASLFINYYTVGKVALVEDNKRWHRCVITEISEGDIYYDEWGELLQKSQYTYFSVFLVDYGRFLLRIQSKSLFPIPTKLVKKLPFQAIYISLSHVWTTGDPCKKECVNYLNEKFRQVDSNKSLQIVAYDRSQCHSSYPSYEYHAMAFTSMDPYDELGEELVLKKFAEYHFGGEELYMKIKESLSKPLEEDPKHSPSKEAPTPSPVIDDDDDEGDWDVYVPCLKPQAITQIEDTVNTLQNVEKGQTKEKVANVSKKTVVGSTLLPLTRWRQTLDHIFITINLPDIEQYNLDVGKNRTLTFVSVTPANYKFEVQTFGFMDKEKEKRTGQNLQVKFKKQISQLWPRFTRSDETLPWLKFDYSDVALLLDENDENEEERQPSRQICFENGRSGNSDTDSVDGDEQEVGMDLAF